MKPFSRDELAELERSSIAAENAERAAKRRHLYETDPLWRLSKNKDNWERRQRVKRAAEAQAFLAKWIRDNRPANERALEAIAGKAWRANRRSIRARAAGGNFRRVAPAPLS